MGGLVTRWIASNLRCVTATGAGPCAAPAPAAARQPSASPLRLSEDRRRGRVMRWARSCYMGTSSKTSMVNRPLPSDRKGCPSVSARAPSTEAASTIV